MEIAIKGNEAPRKHTLLWTASGTLLLSGALGLIHTPPGLRQDAGCTEWE